MSIRRYSSLREPLQHAFLRERLQAARSYKRIAGCFRSSILGILAQTVKNLH